MPYLALLKNPSKIPGSESRIPEAYDFQNLISASFKFLVHRYISGKIFRKIRSVVFT